MTYKFITLASKRRITIHISLQNFTTAYQKTYNILLKELLKINISSKNELQIFLKLQT
jgi:hypothetical protein